MLATAKACAILVMFGLLGVASAGLAEFRKRWPTAQPLMARYAPDALQQTTAAMTRLDAQPLVAGGDTSLVDALLTSYNAASTSSTTPRARQATFLSKRQRRM